jgi:uncharacterized membrane protein YkvA (DUF1232 family)
MDVKEELKEQKYTEAYSEAKLFRKIIRFAKAAGIKVIYLALLLFYTLTKPTTPFWAKAKIIGALGYFIAPLDFIPDLIPGIGYSDDLGALVYAFGAVAMHVDEESKHKAKERLHVWFGAYDESELDRIDRKINNDN